MIFGACVVLLSLLQQDLHAARSARSVVVCLAALLAHRQHLLNEVSLQTINLKLLCLAAVLQVAQLLLPRVRLETPEVHETVQLVHAVSHGTRMFANFLFDALEL